METSQNYSLSGKVFRTLSEQILSGKYQTGDELREVTVGKELGVSRTPVREAFRKLELEGLVTSIPNKGTYVNGISRDPCRISTDPVQAGRAGCTASHQKNYTGADQ